MSEDAQTVALADALRMLPEGDDDIHTFRNPFGMMLGADWPRQEVVDAVRDAPDDEQAARLIARYGEQERDKEQRRCADLCTTESMGKEIVCPEECAAAILARAERRTE